MNTEMLKLLDRSEVLALAESFRIEDAETLEHDYLCAFVARKIRED